MDRLQCYLLIACTLSLRQLYCRTAFVPRFLNTMKRQLPSTDSGCRAKKPRAQVPEYHLTPSVKDERTGTITWPAPVAQLERAQQIISEWWVDCCLIIRIILPTWVFARPLQRQCQQNHPHRPRQRCRRPHLRRYSPPFTRYARPARI